MFFNKILNITLFAVIFLAPSISYAGVLSNANKNSICDITMAHDAIVPFVSNNEIKTINSGEKIIKEISLINRTSYFYKNTKLLAKVFFYDDRSTKSNDKRLNAGRLVDFFVVEESFNVSPGEKKNINIIWNSPNNSPHGKYRIDLYVIQNETHVIGDFARPYTAYASFEFNVNGNIDDYPAYVDMDNALISNVKYLLDSKIITLLPENQDEFLTIPIINTSSSRIKINYKWAVNPYGKFDESKNIYSEINEAEIEQGGELKLILKTPKEIANRYHAVLDIEYQGKHLYEVFRWTRSYPVPALIDTYGVVPQGNYIIDSEISGNFSLEKGKKYVAFACLIGGFIEADTVLTMRLRDEKGRVIFSQEEKKPTATTTAAFEYTFIATKDVYRYALDIVSNTNDMVEKVVWENGCSDLPVEKCQNEIYFENYKTYIKSILIIALMFLVYGFIKKI